MGLRVSDIKDLILNNGYGLDISLQVQQAFKKLIENDRSCIISENSVYPKLWECRWILDESDKTQYYGKGDAVWINTDTEDMIIASRRYEISAYVVAHPLLSPQYEQINKDDSNAINEYFKKVINGTAHKGVSALYFIGDITKPAQIRISNKNENSEYPNTSAWHDFYTPITEQDCRNEIENSLSSCLKEQWQQHIKDYHGNDIQRKTIGYNYLLKDSSTIREDTTKQYFYNHQFFKDMNGFDYVIKQEFNGYEWYRLWSSGYLEQGGFVINDGNDIIRVKFMLDYNYPTAVNFYQVGYDQYNGINMEGQIDAVKRYCVTVTPITIESTKPYQISLKDTNGNRTYTCVDVGNMDNDGFSFINTDTEVKSYGMYCYSVCGFRTVDDGTIKKNIEQQQIHKVNFYDTRG